MESRDLTSFTCYRKKKKEEWVGAWVGSLLTVKRIEFMLLERE